MVKALTKNFPEADEVFDECSDALGMDVRALAWDSSPEQLGKTEKTQVTLVAASIAAWRVWTRVGGNLPHAVAGHSVGALSAAMAGGYIPLAEGIKLSSDLVALRNRQDSHSSTLVEAIIYAWPMGTFQPRSSRKRQRASDGRSSGRAKAGRA